MIGLAWRLARRELRGSFGEFVVVLACLALGVAAIAGANMLNAGLSRAMDEDAQALLGGDGELRLSYRGPTAEERDFLSAFGTLSDTVEMRAMARTTNGDRQTLVEVKGVDQLYPLYGSLRLDPDQSMAGALARENGVWGAAIDANLLDRLGLKLGERLRLGEAEIALRAVIAREPDRVAAAFSLGPRLMVDARALDDTALLQPGALVHHALLIRFNPGVTSMLFKSRIEARFPEAGWQYRDAAGVAPGVKRFLDQMTLFLTLVGLTALLVGGIGVGNGISAFLDGRITTIATLKSLGAPRRLVDMIYGLQVGLLAGLGILIGLILGSLLPWLAVAVFGDSLPVAARLGLYWQPLGLAAACGGLITVCFTAWPLARAAATPAATLFRDSVTPGRRRVGVGAVAIIGAAGVLLVALVIVSAADHRLAAWFSLGSLLSLGLFLGAGLGLVRLARWAAHHWAAPGGWPAWRLALSSLHRPGAPTAGVVLSLGLGLTVLIAIALIQANLARQFGERMPAEAPTYFFIDIQPDQGELFDRTVAENGGTAQRAPMVRGRITRLDGVPVEQVAVAPDAQWAVRGDRGLSSARVAPREARVVAGQWWPADYDGPPLVSLDAGIAKGFGLQVGQTITVNVLGRDITARIANLREIDWSSLSMNFTFLLTPNALAGAPVTYIATVSVPAAAANALERAVTSALPGISSIRVKEALETVKAVADKAGLAIEAAGSVTLAAGVLVLAGAIATSRRRRIRETVLLKVLGASRRDLLAALSLEYLLLGLSTALLAALLGSAVACLVLVFILKADWVFLPLPLLGTMAASLLAVVLLGVGGTIRVLAAQAAPYLRHE